MFDELFYDIFVVKIVYAPVNDFVFKANHVLCFWVDGIYNLRRFIYQSFVIKHIFICNTTFLDMFELLFHEVVFCQYYILSCDLRYCEATYVLVSAFLWVVFETIYTVMIFEVIFRHILVVLNFAVCSFTEIYTFENTCASITFCLIFYIFLKQFHAACLAQCFAIFIRMTTVCIWFFWYDSVFYFYI